MAIDYSQMHDDTDAIDAGDGDRAYMAMKEHLTYVYESYTRFFEYMQPASSLICLIKKGVKS